MAPAQQTDAVVGGQPKAELAGQSHISKMMFGYIDSFVLKLAIDLRIADIINSHGGPMTSADIATQIRSHTKHALPNVSTLERIMRFLVYREVFTAHPPSDDAEPLYGMAPSAAWLLHGSDTTLAPYVVLMNQPAFVDFLHGFTQSVLDGEAPFERFHGGSVWDVVVRTQELNRMFNEGMACTAATTLRAVLSGYADGFNGIGSLVDVGGGTGTAAAAIAKAHPHLKVTCFDRPQVVATAPANPRVSYVGGDMFKEVPRGEAIFMKWIMHDWGDDECVTILRNCRKSIAEKSGKIIIVDSVLRSEEEEEYGAGIYHDMVLLSHFKGGKERTESEWKGLLASAGFPRYKIIEIPALLSIIEAYPHM